MRATIHGKTVGYRAAGTGPAILLIHGMTSSSETWEPVIGPLSECGTVIAPDLLGHGDSAKPRGDYSLGAHASGVRDLLVTLGHERATIVGHSLGGGVAMQFAYQFPERCERLVLVSSGGLGSEVSRLLRALSLPGAEYLLALACTPRLRDGSIAFTRALTRVGLRPAPALAEVLRSYSSLTDAASRQAFMNTLRAVIDLGGQRVGAHDRLYLVGDIPVMIVWGAKDPVIPVSHATAAHDAIPGSRLVIFEPGGHFPHRESPERFAESLTDFIRTTTPARIDGSRLGDRMRDAGLMPVAQSDTLT